MDPGGLCSQNEASGRIPGGIREDWESEPDQQRARLDPGGFRCNFRADSGRNPGGFRADLDTGSGADLRRGRSGRIPGGFRAESGADKIRADYPPGFENHPGGFRAD